MNSLPPSELKNGVAHGAHAAASVGDHVLTVGISSRALFDLSESHALFEREGLDAYRAWQIEHEDEVLSPGVAFPLTRKLLALNQYEPAVPRVEVILLSRNSGDTGLRIFNSIQHYQLGITRAAFTSGAPTSHTSVRFTRTCFCRPMVKTSGEHFAPEWPLPPSCHRPQPKPLRISCALPLMATP